MLYIMSKGRVWTAKLPPESSKYYCTLGILSYVPELLGIGAEFIIIMLYVSTTISELLGIGAEYIIIMLYVSTTISELLDIGA